MSGRHKTYTVEPTETEYRQLQQMICWSQKGCSFATVRSDSNRKKKSNNSSLLQLAANLQATTLELTNVLSDRQP